MDRSNTMVAGASAPATTNFEIDGEDHDLVVWENSRVTLLAHPLLTQHAHDQVRFLGDSFDGERLAEIAGRVCYMSQKNPAEKTTFKYVGDILMQGHGSVLEHANYSFLIEGISRSCSHELVRHRAGFAYSQLSQRYVGVEHLAFVMPPLFLQLAKMGTMEPLEDAVNDYTRAAVRYHEISTSLERTWTDPSLTIPLTKSLARKRVQQVARSVLPNATETKMVVTANARAWRHFLEMRGSPHAEPEIRRLACHLYEVLRHWARDFFQDLRIGTLETVDGWPFQLAAEFKKV